MIRLSICIPTYNFGQFIGQTLDSILPQATSAVEVIILDGGSTDETAAAVQARQQDYPKLKYFNQNFRGGIDRDIEKAVSLAQGQYCWLFSADDIMVPGAKARVLDAIGSGYDIYLCEHDLCSIGMNEISGYPIFNNIADQKIFNLSDAYQKNEYFRSARTSEAFFSFLAGPIFKKKTWDSASIPESFRGTCWIVAGRLLSAIKNGITIQYLGETLIHKREGNDSFSNGSLVNRCRIGIENFQHIINNIFGNQSKEAFQIRRVLHRDIPFRTLLFAKLSAAEHPEKEDMTLLRRLVKMHYADPTIKNWVKLLFFNAAPVPGLKAAHGFKNWIRKHVT